MRNAAATFDDDLGFDAPRRKSAPRKPAAKAAGKNAARKKKGGGLFDMHRVARYAAIGMGAAMAVGIMVNALMMQKGHHPAPLFGRTTANKAATGKPADASAEAPETVASAKAARATAVLERVEAPTPLPAKPARIAAAREAGGSTGADDPIAKLLKSGGATTAADKGESRTVMGVQRALTKLGFKVPATGAAGPATKKAIEAFEKDRHLPVKGDVNRRLVKVLAAESGLRIE